MSPTTPGEDGWIRDASGRPLALWIHNREAPPPPPKKVPPGAGAPE